MSPGLNQRNLALRTSLQTGGLDLSAGGEFQGTQCMPPGALDLGLATQDLLSRLSRFLTNLLVGQSVDGSHFLLGGGCAYGGLGLFLDELDVAALQA